MKQEFYKDLDKIALYIVQGEEHNMTYNEKLLSELTGIPIQTIKKITAKLSEEKYISTAKAGGDKGLSLYPKKKLIAFVAETSFEDEFKESKYIATNNYIDASNNKGMIFQGSTIGSGNTIQSLQEERPAENPINQVSKEHRKITPITIMKSLLDIATKNPLISAIIAMVIGTIILKYYHII
jgi:hypothetical protein